MGYHFKNLAFEGGGVKGIAYLEVLDALTKRNILPGIVRIGRTSAGAINAIILGLVFSLKETKILSGL